MRIGIDCRFLGREKGGLSRYTEKLIENLVKIDLKNQYILFVKKSQISEIPEFKNAKIIPTEIPHYSSAEQISFPFLLFKANCDLIHFLNFNHPLIYKKPYIVTIHDLTLWHWPTKRGNLIKRFAYKKVIKDAVKNAKKIIAVSNFVKNEIVKTLGVKKVEVIYEGVDIPSLTLSQNQKSKIKNQNFLKKHNIKKPYLLYVGLLRVHKNLERLIEAFKILITHYPLPVTLVLVGKEDPDFNLAQKIRELKLEDKVKITGFVPQKDLPLFYQNAEAFIFPSLSEGFGLPGLEAMSYNLPVLASNATALPEIFCQAALYFNPKDPKDMAEKIEKMLTNRELREKLKEAGKKQIKKYSWKKMAEETLKIYKEVAS